jgi:hypothetical protein
MKNCKKGEQGDRGEHTGPMVNFGYGSVPEPEQCSLAWVFMNEFVYSRYIITFLKHRAQGMRNYYIVEYYLLGYNAW